LFYLDNNGYLSNEEVKQGVNAMFDLLGAHKSHSNVADVANECAKELDTSKDGKISKSTFY
jgi:hypothetical protein